jgi:magnesium transporter
MPKKTIYRKNKSKSRPHFLSVPAYLGDRHFPAQTELVQYTESSSLSYKIEVDSNLGDKFERGKNNWLLTKGLSDEGFINKICRSIGLHGFDIRDLLSDQQVIKVAIYKDVIFVIVSVFRLTDKLELDEIKLAFALGENYLISFQENEDSIFEDVKKAISDNILQVRSKPIDFLLYILLNAVNAINIYTILQMENELVDIEELLINGKNPVDTQQLLHQRRINYTQIKRSIVSLREEFSNLTQTKSALINDDDLVYFHNFDDRLRSLYGNLESYHESLISLSDVYYNNNNLIMNNIIKRLTVVSTVFIPLTFLVGVWGMNFKFMPETEWAYGYLFAWICLFVVGVGTFILMKWKKWF